MLRGSFLRCSAGLMLLLAIGCSRDPETLKREYLASGDAYVAQGKLNEAVIEYRNAIQQDARFGDARYKLAEVYTRLNELPNAMREYIRAADLLPDRADVQLKAGTMLLLAGQYDDAKARAEQALKVQPTSLDAHILLGHATAGLKDLDQAVTEIEKGIQENPEESRGYGTLGALQLARGNQAEAEKAFLEAVRLAPSRYPPIWRWPISIGPLVGPPKPSNRSSGRSRSIQRISWRTG